MSYELSCNVVVGLGILKLVLRGRKRVSFPSRVASKSCSRLSSAPTSTMSGFGSFGANATQNNTNPNPFGSSAAASQPQNNNTQAGNSLFGGGATSQPKPSIFGSTSSNRRLLFFIAAEQTCLSSYRVLWPASTATARPAAAIIFWYYHEHPEFVWLNNQ